MLKIAVIGLSGQSIFLNLNHLPKPSITSFAQSYHQEPGGKGYNQAIALKKMGCDVSYLSKVGNDQNGLECQNYMDKYHINHYFIKVNQANTPVGVILTDKQGENEVIVYQDLQLTLTYDDLKIFEDEIKKADVLLIQYEIDQKILKEAIKIAKENHTKVILNPAPAHYQDLSLLKMADILTPNLEEAKTLFAIPNNYTLEEIARYLMPKITNTLIITLGKFGALLINQHTYQFFAPYEVEAVDTTGAGDTFNAGLARCISLKMPIDEAIKYAIVASALSVTKPYVMDAIPTHDEICKVLKLYNLKQKS